MTVKILTTALILGLLNSGSYAQEAFLRLLLIEPSHANGYFILDQNKMDHEGVSTLEVVALVDKLLPDGQMERRLLDQFIIDNGHFGRLDPTLKYGLTDDETLHYQLIGRNSMGDAMVDIAERTNGGWAWPPVCRVNCESAIYAWSLTGFSNAVQTYIDLHNGSQDGLPFYFYVPNELWYEFKENNQPSDFGFFAQEWSDLEQQALSPNEYQPSWEIIHVEELGEDALMWTGYPVANYAGEPGYGIRKDRGPWRGIVATTNNLIAQPSQVCMDLLAFFNANDVVQQTMSQANAPELTCSPVPGPHTGSVSWGSGGPSECFSSIHLWDFDGNLAAWAEALLDCYSLSTTTGEPGPGGGIGSVGLDYATEIVVSAWQPGSSNVIVRVAPNSRDPRLVSVDRTTLEPGFYELRIHLKNGIILRHFEEVSTPMTLSADFANFVDITVYPVPVNEQTFAIDFDLENPMTVNMTVVNNQGVNYYTNSLEFDLAGRNKHVVRMTAQWPNGLYHAHFQFSNGTVQSRSFLVDIE